MIVLHTLLSKLYLCDNELPQYYCRRLWSRMGMLFWHMRISQAQSSTSSRPLRHSRARVVQAVLEGGPSLTSLEKCLTSRMRHSQLQNSCELANVLTILTLHHCHSL